MRLMAGVFALILIWGSARAASTAPPSSVEEDAKAFGALEAIRGAALSPDGKAISYFTPIADGRSALVKADVRSGDTKVLLTDRAGVYRFRHCIWKNNDRLICRLTENTGEFDVQRFSIARSIVVDADTGRNWETGIRPNERSEGMNGSSGLIIDMLPDNSANVLMRVNVLPERQTGTLTAQRQSGEAVKRLSIDTHAMSPVEQPNRDAVVYQTDGHGRVRVMATLSEVTEHQVGRTLRWLARPVVGRDWKLIGTYDLVNESGLNVVGIDQDPKWLLALKPLNGRKALYRIAADASGNEQLLFADDKVDVDGVLRIGKYDRPVAAQYAHDSIEYHYFDTDLAKLSASLGRALPGNPVIFILDESWDGQVKLIYADWSDRPGKYYRYDAGTHGLEELLGTRPTLEARTLGSVRAISYPATDGTAIPGYLTLPPGRASAKGLPAIIMPHGGPSARDTLGFDWLAQFFRDARLCGAATEFPWVGGLWRRVVRKERFPLLAHCDRRHQRGRALARAAGHRRSRAGGDLRLELRWLCRASSERRRAAAIQGCGCGRAGDRSCLVRSRGRALQQLSSCQRVRRRRTAHCRRLSRAQRCADHGSSVDLPRQPRPECRYRSIPANGLYAQGWRARPRADRVPRP